MQKMKLKYNFSINPMGENYVAVPLENDVVEFNGILKLNDSAAFIVEQLNSNVSYEELTAKVAEHFSCDKGDAAENIDSVLQNLKNAGLLVE